MRILIILVPGFSHLSLGAVVEPLHTLGELAPEVDLHFEMGAIGETLVPSAAGFSVAYPLSLSEVLRTLAGAGRPSMLWIAHAL